MIRWFSFFFMMSTAAFCQQLVEGTVVDAETGKPVPFASIGIIGTSKGTSSNLNGQFSISLTEPFSLTVTCIGYESHTVNSIAEVKKIQLKPMATELEAITILGKRTNARKVIRKAFANIPDNFNAQPFLQNFFYRHYCKDDDAYGRLIEASVDVWKNKGYQSQQKSAGENEEIRITQLRRSLDKTEMAQGHEPIAVGNILETDIVGYQTTTKSDHLSFFDNVSNLKVDFDNYSFKAKGITSYDGKEVYEITYSYRQDSALTVSGNYLSLATAKGSLFITTDSYAIVKAVQEKKYGNSTIHTTAYYRKYDDKYYPYHCVVDGDSRTADMGKHSYHIELMSIEVKTNAEERFKGRLPGRDELLNIPYDSVFWTTNTTLKTTPLEDDIIRDLGGGSSLNKQFYRYRQYEMNVRDGGENGEEKFNWFKEDSRNNRILYLVFWSDNFQSYQSELELAKRLQQKYRNKITIVLLSMIDDEKKWQQVVQKYNLYSDGIINYRIGSKSRISDSYKVKEAPGFILLTRGGEVFNLNAKRPSDPLLEEDFKLLIEQK